MAVTPRTARRRTIRERLERRGRKMHSRGRDGTIRKVDQRTGSVHTMARRRFSGWTSSSRAAKSVPLCHAGSMATNIPIGSILGDVVGATGHRYGLRDSAGNTMDTLKIIPDPAGGYLGVYHTANRVNLATSGDLLNWTFPADPRYAGHPADRSRAADRRVPHGRRVRQSGGLRRAIPPAALSDASMRCWRAPSTGSEPLPELCRPATRELRTSTPRR